MLFLSCKANARVKPAKMGHGPHSSKIFVLFCVLFVLCRSVYCLCVNVYCITATRLPPGGYPIAVSKYIISFSCLSPISFMFPGLSIIYTFHVAICIPIFSFLNLSQSHELYTVRYRISALRYFSLAMSDDFLYVTYYTMAFPSLIQIPG